MFAQRSRRIPGELDVSASRRGVLGTATVPQGRSRQGRTTSTGGMPANPEIFGALDSNGSACPDRSDGRSAMARRDPAHDARATGERPPISGGEQEVAFAFGRERAARRGRPRARVAEAHHAARASQDVRRSGAGHLTERMQHHYSTVNGGQQGAALAKVISLFASPSGEWPSSSGPPRVKRAAHERREHEARTPRFTGRSLEREKGLLFLCEPGAERTKSAKPDEYTGRQKP